VSHHIIFCYSICSKCPPPARTQGRVQTLTSLANSTFNNRVTQSGSIAADASFQFVDIRS